MAHPDRFNPDELFDQWHEENRREERTQHAWAVFLFVACAAIWLALWAYAFHHAITRSDRPAACAGLIAAECTAYFQETPEPVRTSSPE